MSKVTAKNYLVTPFCLHLVHLWFQVGQLSAQVERQQVKIRSLIEEQAGKVEEERISIERKYSDILEQNKNELNKVHHNNLKLTSSLEKANRSEAELKRSLEEKEKLLETIRGELDKRVGELQLEIVDVTASKQSVEREMNMAKLRHGLI